MATERSSSDSDVDLDSQIDRFDDFYFGDNGDDVEETGIVAVGASQPGVAPYRHEPVKKSRRSKPAESGGESDAGTGSAAAQRDRPPPRLDNTEWFVIIPAEYNVKQLHKIGIYKVCAYCSNIDLLLGGECDARV